MRISDFDYELPEELIAQHPLERRDASRMLVVNRALRSWRDSRFSEFSAEVKAGDVLVLNNTRVFPARLVGKREPSGGRVELLLVRQRSVDDSPGSPRSETARHRESNMWEALARPARRLERGARLTFGDGRLRAEVLDKLDSGERVVRFDGEGFEELLEEFGRTPLPPYIKRREESNRVDDSERYQTVYAARRGAIAAPTAGLHFTPRVLEAVRARGAEIVEVTLHVGYGTFAPVRADDLSAHSVLPEQSEINTEAAAAVNAAKKEGRRVVAVGTTTVRALESFVDEAGVVRPGARASSLTVTPGYRFRVVDALLTNFHLPRSSLLILVGAFAGRDLALAAYRHAVESRYRFYSYGDCMLIS